MCGMTSLAFCRDGTFMATLRYFELSMKKSTLIKMINDFIVMLNY